MQFCFNVTFQKPTPQESDRRQEIARRHGCDYVEINRAQAASPGIINGNYKAWFETPNRGDPFNGRTAQAVVDELTRQRTTI